MDCYYLNSLFVQLWINDFVQQQGNINVKRHKKAATMDDLIFIEHVPVAWFFICFN